jgi:hypothetical protein
MIALAIFGLIAVGLLAGSTVRSLYIDWRANHKAEDHFWIDRAARRQL